MRLPDASTLVAIQEWPDSGQRRLRWWQRDGATGISDVSWEDASSATPTLRGYRGPIPDRSDGPGRARLLKGAGWARSLPGGPFTGPSGGILIKLEGWLDSEILPLIVHPKSPLITLPDPMLALDPNWWQSSPVFVGYQNLVRMRQVLQVVEDGLSGLRRQADEVESRMRADENPGYVDLDSETARSIHDAVWSVDWKQGTLMNGIVVLCMTHLETMLVDTAHLVNPSRPPKKESTISAARNAIMEGLQVSFWDGPLPAQGDVAVGGSMWEFIQDAGKIRNCVVHLDGRLARFKHAERVRTLARQLPGLTVDADQLRIEPTFCAFLATSMFWVASDLLGVFQWNPVFQTAVAAGLGLVPADQVDEARGRLNAAGL